MLALRSFWRKHKKKLLISVGLIGSGYVVYKLYEAHKRRLHFLERKLEGERQVDELVKIQLQAHFEKIQKIADATTLPYAMHYLRTRISELLDLTHQTERLMQAKDSSVALSSEEKMALWDSLKFRSFTRLVVSLWTATVLNLYIRVLVNILGRHLYLEVARGTTSSDILDSDSSFHDGQQEFLATADFLSTYGIKPLIVSMQNAATEILREKQLKDPFNLEQLKETVVQIFERFKRINRSNFWINYLMPESASAYRELIVASSNDSELLLAMDVGKLDQLMSETRTVLSSPDFSNIVDMSLHNVLYELLDSISDHFDGSSSQGIPLARLLPRVVQLSSPLLEDPENNKYIQMIHNSQEAELFYTLLYASAPGHVQRDLQEESES